MRALAIAVLLAGGAAEGRFAPRRDVPYRLVRVQEHEGPRGQRRFESERRVTFTRTGEGYLARMTLAETHDSGVGGDFARLAAAMGGQPVEVEIDRTGQARQVRALDAIWARLRVAIGQAASGDDLRLALWRIHDAATTAQRMEVVAGVLLTALAPGAARQRAGSRAITLPPTGAGAAVALDGQEQVAIAGRRVTIAIAAAGAGTSVTRCRVVDRRTGLLIEQHEARRTSAIVDGAQQAATDRTTVTLEPVS